MPTWAGVHERCRLTLIFFLTIIGFPYQVIFEAVPGFMEVLVRVTWFYLHCGGSIIYTVLYLHIKSQLSVIGFRGG
jgi:hypothetical protein